MVDLIGSASDSAVSGIVAAEIQLSNAADNIANGSDGTAPVAPFGSSQVAAPLSGTQPSNASSQVFQALQAASPDQSSDTSDLAQQALNVASASQSYQANAQVLKVSDNLTQQAINLVT